MLKAAAHYKRCSFNAASTGEKWNALNLLPPVKTKILITMDGVE